MSLPVFGHQSSLPTEEELAVHASQLAELRTRVTAAQTETGVANAALIAEFAQVQRTFLDGKIRLEQMRMEELLREPVVQISVEESPEPVPVRVLPEDNPPNGSGDRHVLKASTPFWLTVIGLLTALVCFQHSPLCFP